MMETTTVLLDAGGVILDESEHEKERARIAVEVLGRVIPGYSLAALYCDLDEAIERFCPRVLAYVLWKHLKPNKPLYDDVYASFRDEWQHRRPPLKVSEGLEKEVGVLSRDFDIGIAGQYGQDLLALLERSGLLSYFKHRFTQDDFAITKPDPRYLERICLACGVGPRECVMVGDRVDNDIIPARHLEMKTVLVRVGLHKRQEPRTPFEIPDAELDGIAGLADAVSRVARPQ